MSFHKGDRVKADDGREGTLVRRNGPYKQWLVRLDDTRLTFWWESMFTKVTV